MELVLDVSNVFRNINQEMTEEDIKMMNPQSLAFIGDGVFELLVRTMLINPDIDNHNLHKNTAEIVNATSQREFYQVIEESLDKYEKAVVNRGKNVKIQSISKNVNHNDYRWATGLEALFGYLYLMGRDERIEELFNIWRNK